MSWISAPETIGPRQTTGVFSSVRKAMDMTSTPWASSGTKNFWSRTFGRVPSGMPNMMPWLGP
ncbi:hypothetical protein D9M69_285880 [compost metagenome]